MEAGKIHRIVVSVLMWLLWCWLLLGVAVLLTFAYMPAPESQLWMLGFNWWIVLAVLLAVPLGLRFGVVPRFRNPWWIFLFFCISLFLSYSVSVIGMFALLHGQQVYILAGVVSIFLFCPQWMLAKPKPIQVIEDENE